MPDQPELVINELFYSIQGESTWAGLPCVFVRLTGCHLRCHYCDTEYAFKQGRRMTLDEIIQACDALCSKVCNLYEITGGEPLLQPHACTLMSQLADTGKTILVETSGACDISLCDDRAIRIMDLKTPGSGEVERNDWANIDRLTRRDEVKFVLTSREDYEWMRQVIERYDLSKRVNAVLVSAVNEVPAGLEIAGTPGLALRDLAAWLLEDHLPVRMQTQLHKQIWDPMARGV